MSETRSRDLQHFVDALKAAFTARTGLTGAEAVFVGRLFGALETAAPHGITAAQQLPVCGHLPEVYASARLAGAEVARLTDAFERIAPLLTWKVRPSSGPHASDNWPDGHANAMIIGQGGIEERGDIAIGASLMARHVRYPDHTHPPEELYMILTQGRFQHGDEPWCEPGPGATFHNTPGIRHAMASGAGPLLAVWTMLVA